MTTHVNDSGTWRTLQGVQVNDASVWRTLKSIEVNDSGTWRTVYISAVTKSMTIATGTDGAVFDFAGFGTDYGSIAGLTDFGSISPDNVINPSITLRFFADRYATGGSPVTNYNDTFMAIDGFGANPGQSYFASIDVNSKNYTSASATYAFSGTTATWSWGTRVAWTAAGNPWTWVMNF